MMKKCYNDLIKFLELLIVRLHVLKMLFAEKYALARKKTLYKDVMWSHEQISAFNTFWTENLGRKIDSRGHKLYQSINGAFHKDYFPDFLFATKLEPKLNSYLHARLYSDKSLTELLYSKSTKLKMPATYLVKSSGLWYNSDRTPITAERAKELLLNLGEAIVKPTIGGNSGKGIGFCNFVAGRDMNSDTTMDYLFSDLYNDFIVQEKLTQHVSYNKLYPHSINTIRISTYIADEQVFYADLCLRLGTGGAKVDNIHAGGIGVGVEVTGLLKQHAYKLGYSDSAETLEKHPDTGVTFLDYEVAGINSIIETALELHGLTPHIGMVSWDFMVNTEGEAILIEANYMGQAVWFAQIVHGKPFFGDNTAYMLNLLTK